MRSRNAGDAHLLDRLLADNRIGPGQYEAALNHFKRMGGRVEEALLEVNAITEADLLKYLAALHKTRFVSTDKLAKADINRLTLDKVPKKLAEAAGIFPVLFDAQQSVLSVVTADPDDFEALKELQIHAGVREVRAFVARPAAVRAAVNKAYGGDIHAFAILDKSAHDQFQSMLNVYERNLVSEESMAVALVDARERERVLSQETLERPGSTAVAKAGTAGVAGDAYVDTLNVLVSLLENTRTDLRGHSSHVARLTRKIAERIGLAPADLHAIVVAAYLHDLGKMSAYHLTALNVAEYEGHRVAAQKAYVTPRRLFDAVGLTSATATALESMYERYDGKGFPASASGKDIALGGRIIAITDTYADLTQNPRNPFRKALRPLEACDVLIRFKGTVFDPNLVDLFKHMVTGDDVTARLLANRHRALLVDPDPEETTVLELRMIEQGFEVSICRTTDQAAKALASGDFELVISEADLQPQDGFVLLHEARSQSWGRDLVWVMLTRRAARADVQRGFELGVTDYVSKPVTTDAFVAKLKQLIERQATTRTAKGVSGSLTEMSLPDIVQVLWHGRKTGALRIRCRGESGELHFIDGNIVNAMMGKLRGEDAFYSMLRLNEGEFGLDPNFAPPATVINASPEALLLEGMRRLDEGTI
jgi:response regulator RpfG family c-di-GMP phosphodiesterase